MVLYICLKGVKSLHFRSIKRKKFDDELVESSLAKSTSRVKGQPVIEPIRCPGSDLASSDKKKVMNVISQTSGMFDCGDLSHFLVKNHCITDH